MTIYENRILHFHHQWESSYHPLFSPASSIVSILNFQYSTRFAVVLHYCYNLHFLMTYNVQFFQMLIFHLCIFFAELLRSLANFINNWLSQFSLIIEFVFQLFSFKCPFYILNYNPLSHVSFANISFLSVACLFIQLFISELKILINPGVQNKLYSSVEKQRFKKKSQGKSDFKTQPCRSRENLLP